MDPYDAERKGIRFRDYRKLQNLADEKGYVDPYRAEYAGVPFKSWSEWQRDYERRRN